MFFVMIVLSKKGQRRNVEMKNLKKILSLVLAGTMALTVLAGCGNDADDSGGKKEEQGAAESSKGGDKVVLSYWGWDSNFYKPMMEAFQKKYPEVEFEITEVASADYVTKVQQCIASGMELPDILVSEANYRGQMLSIDMWEDLTKEPYDLKDDMFFDSYLNQMKNADGKIMCVDQTVCPSAFAYKRDLAKQYLGTDDPDKLAAMLPDIKAFCDAAEKVQTESGGSVKLFSTIGAVAEWLRGKEAASLVNDNGDVDFTGKYKQTIEDACQLRDAGAIDVIEQWSAQDNAAYAQSNHIFFPAANWSLEFSIKPNDPDGSGNWGMFIPEGNSFSWGGTAMGISKESKNKEMAWNFIRFCTMEDEGIQVMKEKVDYYTPYKAPYDNPEYTSKVDAYFADQDVGKLLYQDIMPKMKIAQRTEYDGVASEVLTLVLNNIIADESVTSEQALTQALEEMQNRLPDVVVK